MTEIRGDILAALRTQEAALLAVLETVRQAIQTVLASHPPESFEEPKTETIATERQFMNGVLTKRHAAIGQDGQCRQFHQTACHCVLLQQ